MFDTTGTNSAVILLAGFFVVFLLLAFAAWRRYLWVANQAPDEFRDTCPYSLTETFRDQHLVNAPHQKGAVWLTDIFSRSARKYPDFSALQIPHTGESLTYAELDCHAERVAAAITPYVTGPDQVVAVAMSQDNWQIVASHLGILRAGGVLMFLDTTLPDAQIDHMVKDADPVLVLTRGEARFRDLPTLDVCKLPESHKPVTRPIWLDDPAERLATLFYTSGTTGMPKGVENAHSGYVNLALTYADYFDLLPGMDATSLTSSLGYDGSISEMYSAWVIGCSVVLLTKEEVRSGPDLIPILRDAEVTMLFCPPVLLTTLTQNPEIDLPYPICRYIVPAGEAFPNALVEPWTRCRRQVINTYGPTEASTDTSRQSLRPGQPVSIGSPLANVTYVILDLDSTDPLPHGEEGELCIGGVHVARGYRNLPDQTAERFITHPTFGRLYRSGDKCKIDPASKQVHFLGRVDTQMKVRGHRVEAQAVEDILQNQFAEIESAILDYQHDALVAFAVAPSVSDLGDLSVAAAPADWSKRIIEQLASQLPQPAVPSRIYLVKKFTMKPVSGKIDRSCLPDHPIPIEVRELLHDPHLDSPTVRTVGDEEAGGPSEGIESGSEEILEICRDVFDTPVDWDDRFSDAGGHSIAIARLAHRLQTAGWSVPVRGLLTDLNTARKIAELPRHQAQVAMTATASEKLVEKYAERDEAAAKTLSVGIFTFRQILFSALIYAPGVAVFLGVFLFVEFGQFFTAATLLAFVSVGIFLYFFALLLPFFSLPWVMLIKFFMSGSIYKNNVTPGIYPKWSKMHLRIWSINRLEKLALPLVTTYRSAPLLAFILRQLGSTVGKNLQCAQDAGLSGPFDMIMIDDDVAIQT
ncbi:MAG: AMP-binding protein, partial [Rhizobiaceae bacterium]